MEVEAIPPPHEQQQPAQPHDPPAPIPPHSTQPLNPQPPTAPPPPAAAAAAGQQNTTTRKRKLENAEFRKSSYFKIRAIVRNLRPSFIEVLHAPDFRDCKAAHEIRKQMKVILDLSKQLRVEAAYPAKEDTAKVETQAGLFQSSKAPKTSDTTAEKSSQPEKISGASDITHKESGSDKASNPLDQIPEVPEAVILEAKKLEQQLQDTKGTYIVGGSPIGWNFVVYPGSEPVYYGVTKENWLSHQRLQAAV